VKEKLRMIRSRKMATIAAVLMGIGIGVAGGMFLTRAGQEASLPQPSIAVSPDPSLSPSDVIVSQLSALQDADAPTPNAGIARAFAFASPANQMKTGPLSRFIEMVRSPVYSPLLGFQHAELGPLAVSGSEARQMVRLFNGDSQSVMYLFILTRQEEGIFEGCWLTDGVIRVHAPPAGPRSSPVYPEGVPRPVNPEFHQGQEPLRLPTLEVPATI